MKRICLVNGSLRGKQASSLQFLKDIESRLPDSEYVTTRVSVKARPVGGYPPKVLEQLAAAEALVLVFPLYSYALPGALMRLFEDYYAYVRSGNEHNPGARVYAIVNCGFPRPVVFDECIRVLKNICRRLSLNWRFAVCISSGPVVVVTRRLPLLDLKLKKGFAAIVSDLQSDGSGPRHDYFVRPVIPEPILQMWKRRVEKQMEMR